jgi:hypothetical protein
MKHILFLGSIKENKIIFIFSFCLILPIFLYFNNSQISLNNCEDGCIALNSGTIILIFFTIYLIINSKHAFILSFFLSFYLLDFLFFKKINYLLGAIKSIMPFFFLITYFVIAINFKLNLKIYKFILNFFLPYCIIFFQIIFFFSLNSYDFTSDTTSYLFNFIIDTNPFFIFDQIKVYNYNQYFSFILVLVCGVRLFLISNKKEIFFISLVMFSGSIHAVNFNALICALIIFFFKFTYFYSSKSKLNIRIFRLLSYLIASSILIIPIFGSLALNLIEYSYLNIPYNLTTRLLRYYEIFSQLDFSNFLFGIYPDPFDTRQPHSQFLEYILYFGVFRALFLIVLIFFMLSKIRAIEYLLPLCVIIGFGGSINEIISHLYTGQIIFFYAFISSLLKKTT